MQFTSTRALDALDVTIPNGVTGLVGANGAGKTTLISLVLGLLKPTTGSISVLGLDPDADGPELRAMIGYGPERNVFPDDLRAYDFVRHLAEVKGLPRDEARSRASDSLYLVGLGEERFRALGTMSTGQRQRVKLAQAIAADPRLIVLDEPTDGLDPVQRDEMLNIIVQVNRDFGIDVMLSSHVLEEVERVCDHVVALAEGRLVAQGSMAELAGASGGIELELVELLDRPTSIDDVAALLTAAGAGVRRSGATLSVVGMPDDDLFDLAAQSVARAGARIRKLGQHRRSLDDIFAGSVGRRIGAVVSGRGDAQIVERGFQRYEGRRSGVPGAIRSVSWEGIRATLGLGRPARTKIFPVIAVVIAYVPAIVFVGIAVLIPGDILEPEEVADYPGYYGFIILAIVLFAALVAPEVLVSDRRNGMLAMYLSTPLDRRTYLVAKAVAVVSTLGLVTLGPPVLLLIGYTVENAGPDGVAGWLWTLVRIVLSGVAISAALAAVSMAASSLTDRRAFAAIGIVLLVLASPILAAALVEGADLSPSLRLIDISTMPFELVFRIFDQPGNFPELSTWSVLLSNIVWTVGGVAVVWWRYSKLVIAR